MHLLLILLPLCVNAHLVLNEPEVWGISDAADLEYPLDNTTENPICSGRQPDTEAVREFVAGETYNLEVICGELSRGAPGCSINDWHQGSDGIDYGGTALSINYGDFNSRSETKYLAFTRDGPQPQGDTSFKITENVRDCNKCICSWVWSPSRDYSSPGQFYQNCFYCSITNGNNIALSDMQNLDFINIRNADFTDKTYNDLEINIYNDLNLPQIEPTKTSTENPRETSTEDPIETSTENPRETSTEDPIETLTENPRETSTEDPIETLTKNPTEIEPTETENPTEKEVKIPRTRTRPVKTPIVKTKTQPKPVKMSIVKTRIRMRPVQTLTKTFTRPRPTINSRTVMQDKNLENTEQITTKLKDIKNPYLIY